MKKVILLGMMVVIGVSSFAQADKTEARKANFNLASKQTGIKGYDPVAYFTQGKAKEGKPAITATYQGINYYFESAANRDLFKANPSKYEPQYGGWCAYAMGNDGSKVEVDPETFKVTNGKLYLFYNRHLSKID